MSYQFAFKTPLISAAEVRLPRPRDARVTEPELRISSVLNAISYQLQTLTGQGSTVINLGSGTTVSPEVDFYGIPATALQKLIDVVKATPGDVWQDWQGMIDDVHGALQGVQGFLAARAEIERLKVFAPSLNPAERDGHLAA